MTRQNKYFDNKVCWISGGGSGIGASLARQAAALGSRVIISGRNDNKLKETAKGHENIDTIPFDISCRDQWQNAVEKVSKKYGKIDIIIFNAGICEYVDLPEFDSEKFKRVMDINFFGIVYGVELCLPLLRKSNSAHIAAVSSSVASLPLPTAEAYGSSKAAASYLMNSLRLDLSKEKIAVSVILPGFVSTPLTDKNDFPMPFTVSSETAATRIIKGLSSQKKEIYFPGPFTWPLRFLAILPVAIQQLFTKRTVR